MTDTLLKLEAGRSDSPTIAPPGARVAFSISPKAVLSNLLDERNRSDSLASLEAWVTAMDACVNANGSALFPRISLHRRRVRNARSYVLCGERGAASYELLAVARALVALLDGVPRMRPRLPGRMPPEGGTAHGT